MIPTSLQAPSSLPHPSRLARSRRAPLLAATAAVLLGCGGLGAVSPARAQQGAVATGSQQQTAVKIDRMFDLNGDGVIDEHERELALQYMYQNAYLDANGRPDKAKLRAAIERKKKFEEEQRLIDEEPELLAKQAKGKTLSSREEARLRQAAEIRARRQQEREQARRNAAAAPQSAAAQKLTKPIIDY
ncbi:MAG: hypothetical protein JO295_04235 [Verrucomicrobia bacterium]|nr:hypothetical protein [Verrucomicrobiota bacterium]